MSGKGEELAADAGVVGAGDSERDGEEAMAAN